MAHRASGNRLRRRWALWTPLAAAVALSAGPVDAARAVQAGAQPPARVAKAPVHQLLEGLARTAPAATTKLTGADLVDVTGVLKPRELDALMNGIARSAAATRNQAQWKELLRKAGLATASLTVVGAADGKVYVLPTRPPPLKQ